MRAHAPALLLRSDGGPSPHKLYLELWLPGKGEPTLGVKRSPVEWPPAPAVVTEMLRELFALAVDLAGAGAADLRGAPLCIRS